jgi:hypothetical protein
MHVLFLATTTFSLQTATSQAGSHQTSVGSGNSNSGNNSNSASNTSSNQSTSSINIGAIVGGSVGGLFVLVLLGIFIWWCTRKHSRQPKRKEDDSYPTPENKHWKSNEPTPTPTPNPYPAYPGPIIPETTPAPIPPTTHTSLYTASSSPAPGGFNAAYQPPPPEGTNPFNAPYPTPGEQPYQPPPSNNIYGAPPGAGGAAGGYNGRAEVY